MKMNTKMLDKTRALALIGIGGTMSTETPLNRDQEI